MRTLLLGRPSAAGNTEIDESGQAHLTYIYKNDHNADYALNITFYGPSRLSMQAVVVFAKMAVFRAFWGWIATVASRRYWARLERKAIPVSAVTAWKR